MIITFPTKYSVAPLPLYNGYAVQVPVSVEDAVVDLLRQQPWISSVATGSIKGSFIAFVSGAYDASQAQIVEAIGQLCEFVMAPPVAMDSALEDELDLLLAATAN
jgi:hypothetical protein